MSILFKLIELLYKIFGEKFLIKVWKLAKKEFRHMPLVFTLLTVLVIAIACGGVVLVKYSNIVFNKGGSLHNAILHSINRDQLTGRLTDAILRSGCSPHNFHGLILFERSTALKSQKADLKTYLFYFPSLRNYMGDDIRFQTATRRNAYLTPGYIGSHSSDAALINKWHEYYQDNTYMISKKESLLDSGVEAFKKFINRDGVNLCKFYTKPIFDKDDNLRYVLTLSAECKPGLDGQPCKPPHCEAYDLEPICSPDSLFNEEQIAVEDYLRES